MNGLILGMLSMVMLQACAQASEDNPDMLAINLMDYKTLAFHMHPHLEIEILGEQYVIPANIGASRQAIRVIHTHEPDGTLHVESPYPHQFVLADFFTIWGERFDKTCIFNYCIDEEHELLVFVNGGQSDLYENTPLREDDEIKIVYRKSIGE